MLMKLTTDNYSTFIDLVKHSQLGNTILNSEMRADFERKFINSSVFSTNLKMVKPLNMSDQVGALVNLSSHLKNLSFLRPFLNYLPSLGNLT